MDRAITSAQIRAARALIGWSAFHLADRAGLGVSTIRRAETSDGSLTMTLANMAAVPPGTNGGRRRFHLRCGRWVGG
jgi:hypothetical protein